MPRHSFAPYLGGRPLPAGDPWLMRVTRHGAPRSSGEFVLCWLQASRRIDRNLTVEWAIAEANHHRLPVVVYESLRPDYPGANDRLHAYILDGVESNRSDAERRGLRYTFFLPRRSEDARGVLVRLAARARTVVTDEFPTFVFPGQTARLAKRAGCEVVTIDGNGLLPMRAFEKEQYSARFFRDRAHARFHELLAEIPAGEPAAETWEGDPGFEELGPGFDRDAVIGECAIDHSVSPVRRRGGRELAMRRLQRFTRERLEGYAATASREPERSSELSSDLHFGFIGAHEIFEAVRRATAPLEDVDAFLEQAVIRRELSFNLCFFRRDHDALTALPDWAMKTLDAHRGDRRKPAYTYEELEAAQTGDDVWNLAQRGLLVTGTMHNYLRMLWGKKIIEWSPTPEEAFETMAKLHERYATDGRDPNTWAGILWCFGKHDRPWAPERPIFGTIRWMSSDSTRRKVDLDGYEAKIEREAAER